MSCCQPSDEQIEKLRSSMSRSYSEIFDNDRVTQLLRGGVVVKTKIGNIQVGMPPETIKDSIVQQLGVPTMFVIPSRRYCKESFINVAEFEFPAYFNFFVLKTRVRLCCTPEQEEKIRAIFQETLLGPKEFPDLDDEFNELLPPTYRPNFVKELGGMAVNPFTREKLVVETLLDFKHFDEDGICVLPDGVTIHKESSHFEFFEDDKLVARVPDKVTLNPANYYTSKMLDKEKHDLCEHGHDHTNTNTMHEKISPEQPLGFTPPDFGVTVLGASHGFDATGSTSGYILWINQRGVMVDPPPFSSQNLAAFGIPPNLIDKCILTHCHADHDSGIFQKIMHSNTIELITTPTIMKSFIRKYSALTDIEPSIFQSLFIFRPVTIGSFIDILGASFRFFYSYHSIPCVGFESNYCGRSLFFSGDTFFDPDALGDRLKSGIFSKERFDSLVDINWAKYDIILHEAGVPPIHTSTKVLSQFPDEIKENMYLVHIADKDVPPGIGLKAAKTGLMNTIVLTVNPQLDPTMQKLDLLSSIKFLNEIPLYKTRDLVRCCKMETYMPGQVVIRENTYGSKFYIVMNGICKIKSDDPSKKFSKYAYSGDYFGETALIDQGKRNADVVAHTNLTLLCIDKSDFKWVFGLVKNAQGEIVSTDLSTGSIVEKLKNLTATRKNKYSEFINKNIVFRGITESQKVQVNMFIKYTKVAAGELLWSPEKPPTFCFFMMSGQFTYATPASYRKRRIRMRPGCIVGDFPSLAGEACQSELTATADSEILQIKKEDWLIFLGKNPGLLLLLKDEYLVE